MLELAEKCFEGVPTHGIIMVAVSGGSDSMALLLLANAWAIKNNVELQAITIDHGLRPEAASEAAFVSSVCAGLDIEHLTLAWDGAKPVLGIQNAARQARYNLLDEFGRQIGSNVILTGHTLDDQAETVFMRNQRHGEGSHGDGMSGMARKTWLYGGTEIHRPLLGVSRQSLRQVLIDFSQSWIEDPSNNDESYERVRVRNMLVKNPDLAVQHLLFSNICGRLRATKSRAAAFYLFENFSVLAGPVFELKLPADLSASLDSSSVSNANLHPVFCKAVQTVLALSGGQKYLTSMKRLNVALIDLLSGEKPRINIGGSIVELVGSSMRFTREVRNLSSIVFEPGEAGIWDGRMFVFNGTSSTIFVEPAKRAVIKQIEEANGTPFTVKPRQAMRSTPIIHIQTDASTKVSEHRSGLCLPLIDASDLPAGLEIRLAMPAIEHFCPEFDAPLRDWVLSLDQFSAASLIPKR